MKWAIGKVGCSAKVGFSLCEVNECNGKRFWQVGVLVLRVL